MAAIPKKPRLDRAGRARARIDAMVDGESEFDFELLNEEFEVLRDRIDDDDHSALFALAFEEAKLIDGAYDQLSASKCGSARIVSLSRTVGDSDLSSSKKQRTWALDRLAWALDNDRASEPSAKSLGYRTAVRAYKHLGDQTRASELASRWVRAVAKDGGAPHVEALTEAFDLAIERDDAKEALGWARERIKALEKNDADPRAIADAHAPLWQLLMSTDAIVQAKKAAQEWLAAEERAGDNGRRIEAMRARAIVSATLFSASPSEKLLANWEDAARVWHESAAARRDELTDPSARAFAASRFSQSAQMQSELYQMRNNFDKSLEMQREWHESAIEANDSHSATEASLAMAFSLAHLRDWTECASLLEHGLSEVSDSARALGARTQLALGDFDSASRAAAATVDHWFEQGAFDQMAIVAAVEALAHIAIDDFETSAPRAKSLLAKVEKLGRKERDLSLHAVMLAWYAFAEWRDDSVTAAQRHADESMAKLSKVTDAPLEVIALVAYVCERVTKVRRVPKKNELSDPLILSARALAAAQRGDIVRGRAWLEAIDLDAAREVPEIVVHVLAAASQLLRALDPNDSLLTETAESWNDLASLAVLPGARPELS